MKILALLISLFYILLNHKTLGAVIGIDFGTQFFKISLNSPKKSFLIVENTTSDRKTMNTVKKKKKISF